MLKQLKLSDFVSGILLFFISIPLVFGISIASNLPVSAGLVTTVIGGTIVLFLSKSNILVSGPSAGLIAITLSIMAQFSDFHSFLLAVMMSGAIQIMLGLAKMGDIYDRIPPVIIRAVIIGIAILILVKQIPFVFGYNSSDDTFNIGCTIISMLLVPFFILSQFDTFKQRTYKLLLLLLSVAIAFALILPFFFPHINMPKLSGINVTFKDLASSTILGLNINNIEIKKVLVTGISLGVISSAESLIALSSIKILGDEKPASFNSELINQGLGNLLCGLLGGLPLAIVVVRSSFNQINRVQSKLPTLFCTLLIFFSMIWFEGLFSFFPLCIASLFYIIIAIFLIKTQKESLALLSVFNDYRGTIIFLSTIISIVFSDLLHGVVLGGALFLTGLTFDFIKENKSEIKIGFVNTIIKQKKTIILLGSALSTYLISISGFIDYQRGLINNLQIFGTIFSVATLYFWEKGNK